jgi:hypothetical protein
MRTVLWKENCLYSERTGVSEVEVYPTDDNRYGPSTSVAN